MATEIKPLTDARWPASLRLPVALTFEHQSGEGAPLLPGDRPNAMIGGAMQYGARTGIWNILELLDTFGIKATFLICGTTAEKYPEAIRAAHQAGHEIGGMGYGFDRVRTMSVERERGLVRKAVNALRDASGARITGWRCPDYRVSPQTLDILSEEGFLWDFKPSERRSSVSVRLRGRHTDRTAVYHEHRGQDLRRLSVSDARQPRRPRRRLEQRVRCALSRERARQPVSDFEHPDLGHRAAGAVAGAQAVPATAQAVQRHSVRAL